MKRRIIIVSLILFCLASIFFVYFKEKGRNASENKAVQGQPAKNESLSETISDQIEAAENLITGDDETKANNQEDDNRYPLHKNITSTIFWVGEKASDANKDISNSPSAWDDYWKKHFGGTDNSKRRNGYYPADFTPQENPFYVALPYNDIGKDGKRKQTAYDIIPWAKERTYSDSESLCKNRWVQISKNSKMAYAQWEDVGPFKENDSAYVFGSATPASSTNKNSGLDASPAVRDYLGLKDIDKLDWRFIDDKDVPQGPWKKIVTVSQIDWK